MSNRAIQICLSNSKIIAVHGVLLGAAVLTLGGNPADSSREHVIEQMRSGPDRVQAFEGGELGVIACAVTVAFSKDEPSTQVAMQTAVTVAAIQARAEVALFVAGEYSGSTVVEKTHEVSPNREVSTIRISQFIQSLARTRLLDGERVLFERPDEHSIRVVYAWGVERAVVEFPEGDVSAALTGILEQSISSNENPSPDIRVVRLPNGSEALLIVVVVIAPRAVALDAPCEHPAGESPEAAKNGKPCLCVDHRRNAVNTISDSTVLKWLEGGDTSCSRVLRRESAKTISRISEGAKALEVVLASSSKDRLSTASTSFKDFVGPEWYRSRIVQTRVTPELAGCAVLIPIPKVGSTRPEVP